MNPYSEANFLDKIRCVETRSYNRSRLASETQTKWGTLASETQTKWGTVVRANSVLWGMQRIGPKSVPKDLVELSSTSPESCYFTGPLRGAGAVLPRTTKSGSTMISLG